MSWGTPHLDRFVDTMQKVSQLADLQATRSRITTAARPRCGNCNHWMKSRDCPQERNVNGMTSGPSSAGSPCSKFVFAPVMRELFDKQIADSDSAIAALKGGTPC